MRKLLARSAAAAAAAVLTSSVIAPTASARIDLFGHDQVRTLPCNDDVKLVGSDNAIVLTSACKRIEVNGHDNTITCGAGKKPTVKSIGSDNSYRC
ncbi:DUF3060 domain-containing protein [Tsukamurella ocularis]|uniref:DUF3060 domain-containing protein n=1 Tax=Tsukamurella ocularis TaxID=1970234 RepID=UPI002169C096|nr:DUF3060 domain-containing protein [Tsukamurella ocularis]MCS3781752.1 hypothetical protein [Tsukamurella ocularis]MCS3788246.1 hypothetical protein [Tsukamurella ocularis]MCS3851966.1 hypothetical protein [Tsukamurella ocularis]